MLEQYAWDHCLVAGSSTVQWVWRHLLELKQIRCFFKLQNSICCCNNHFIISSMKTIEPVAAIHVQTIAPPPLCFTGCFGMDLKHTFWLLNFLSVTRTSFCGYLVVLFMKSCLHACLLKSVYDLSGQVFFPIKARISQSHTVEVFLSVPGSLWLLSSAVLFFNDVPNSWFW